MTEPLVRVSTRSRAVAANLLLVAASLMVGLGIAELAARAFYTAPWYDRLVAAQTQSPIAPPPRNSLGLRGPAYLERKAPGVTRILLLGDSFTFGSGVAEDDSIWASRLERALRADGLRVEILNGGAAGLLTDSWVSLLERVKDSFQPDLILAVFFLRDGTKLGLARHFFVPIRQQIVEKNQRSRLYRHLYLFRWMRDALDRRRIGESYSRNLIRAYVGDSVETEEWRAAQANLRHIQMTGRQIGAPVGLVVFPALIELDAPAYPFQQVVDVIGAFGDSLGLPTLHLLPFFRGRDATTLWVSALDQHPNAQGHAIAASALLPFVHKLRGSTEQDAISRVDSR